MAHSQIFRMSRMGIILPVALAALISANPPLEQPLADVQQATPAGIKQNLRLVSIFQRHGDRSGAPEILQPDDPHTDYVDYFWPNGLTNLTDDGRERLFEVGKELRQLVGGAEYLDYNTSKVLALSSSVYRCVESAQNLLRGLYNIEQTQEKGRDLLDVWRKCQLQDSCSASTQIPSGSGAAEAWKNITIDTELVPYLDLNKFDDCIGENQPKLEENLLTDPTIRSLPGILKLRQIMRDRYGRKELDSFLVQIYSTVLCELEVVRTKETVNLTSQFADWINQPLRGEAWSNEEVRQGEPTLFDLLEQVVGLYHHGSIQGDANYVLTGTMLTTLVEGMKVALGREDGVNKTRLASYKDKKLILYLTHDTNIKRFLETLGVISLKNQKRTFEAFNQWRKTGDKLDGLLSGINMPSYGLSAQFQLIELQRTDIDTKESFPIVNLNMYNEDYTLPHNVEYKPINLGVICRQMFKKLHPRGLLAPFYKPALFPINDLRSCPFELFLNVTSAFAAEDSKVKEICDNNS